MRRNRSFRVGDIITLVDGMTQNHLKTMLWALEKAGFLELVSDKGSYKEWSYRLILNTGPQSPSVIRGEIYDHNTKKFYPKKERGGSVSRTLIAMLGTMTKQIMTKREIAEAAGTTVASGGTKTNFSLLTKKGIMQRPTKDMRYKGSLVYRINRKAAAELREQLIRDAGLEEEYGLTPRPA